MEKADRSGVGILSYGSDNYPQEMLCAVNCSGRPDIPLTLYCKGNLEALKHPGVAVIGTRHPSPAGRRHAEYCGERLAEAGCNIISGLAAGCDAAAHRGALSCPGGRTTALLGHGLDTVYPREHASLARDILEHDGLLISEYPLGTRVTPFTLTARDRLQAALAQSVLVVQALRRRRNHAYRPHGAGRRKGAVLPALRRRQSGRCGKTGRKPNTDAGRRNDP